MLLFGIIYCGYIIIDDERPLVKAILDARRAHRV
jgi:hypothetical protein